MSIGLRICILSIFIALPFGAKSQSFSENLEQLAEWMSGAYSSADQAKSDTAFYEISLRMARIWPKQPNGIWLYVEQAMASTPDKPYRQRIYFLSEIADDEFSSDVYLIPNEADYIGAWAKPAALDKLTPFELQHKPGCVVFLFFDGFQYGGKTNEKTCGSELRGASYTTSEVVLVPGEIHTWDRGFDATGKQVWGSEAGPYIFKKK